MENRVCEILGIEKPIISAAMVWLNDAESVAAVSNAGGAGVLGLFAGSTTVPKSVEEDGKRLRQEIRKLRELTDKPFGVNFFMGDLTPSNAETLKIIEEEKVPFVLALPSGPTINQESVKRLKAANVKIVYRPMTPTIEAMKEGESFADILICTGSEAGGHKSEYDISLLSLFPVIRKAIKAPLMAAGGICEELAAKAVAAMGAEGIYAGTCFLTTIESPTHPRAKQALLEAKAEDIICVPSVSGFINLLPYKTGLECKKMLESGASGVEIDQYFMNKGAFLTGMLLGDLDVGIVNTSNAINNINNIKTSKEVVDELSKPFS